MAERFTADLLFIIFVLLVAALLGFLIGYYLRKSMKCKDCLKLEEENADLKLKIDGHVTEIAALKLRTEKQEEEITALKLNAERLLSEAKLNVAFDAGLAREALGFRVNRDDLRIVEGIGPKISGILKKRGITTWKALSEASPELIKDYLINDGGPRYRIHVPDTWPGQAKLAHLGQWQELKAYQDKLLAGKIVS